MRKLATVAAFAVAMAVFPAAAQTTIPYDGHEIEADPNGGTVQCVVWERDEIRHEDPDGITMSGEVIGVVIFEDSDHGWIVVGHVKRPIVGVWNLNVGDDCGPALLGEQ
jgi:hypothetical protein